MDVVYNHTAEGDWTQDGRLAFKCYDFCDDVPRVYRDTGNGWFANDSGTGNDVDFSGGGRFTKSVPDSLSYGTAPTGSTASGSTWHACWPTTPRTPPRGSTTPARSAAHLHAEPWDMGGHGSISWTTPATTPTTTAGRSGSAGIRDDRGFSKSTLRTPRLKRHLEGRGLQRRKGPASSRPWRSVNILAVHDGYTLRDTVFFNDSGGSHNCWDSGGDENLRREREKLLLGVLLTSQGVPLILQGGRVRPDPVRGPLTGRRPQHVQLRIDLGRRADQQRELDRLEAEGRRQQRIAERPQVRQGTVRLDPRPDRGAETVESLPAVRLPRLCADAANGGKDAGSANDGRFTYAWEGPPDGSPTQLAVIWWGKPGEPDLMIIYNEASTPFTVENLGNWSQGDWKVLARSWADDAHDFADLEQWEALARGGGSLHRDQGPLDGGADQRQRLNM